MSLDILKKLVLPVRLPGIKERKALSIELGQKALSIELGLIEKDGLETVQSGLNADLDKFGSDIMRQSYLHDNTPIYKKVVFIVAQKAAKKTIITIVTIKSPKNKKLDYIL